MSTSPSWFDQEKFSRLVKKVGPKAVPAAATPVVSAPAAVVRAPVTKSPEKETKRLQRSAEVPPPVPTVARARTAPLPPEPTIRAPSPADDESSESSPFPTPLAPPEPRQVSPLSKRTTPLPDLKSIFEYEESSGRSPLASQPLPGRPTLIPPAETKKEESAPLDLEEEAIPPWPLPIGFGEQPTPKAVETGDDFSQLSREELLEKVKEFSGAADERDAARTEVKMLNAQLQQADEIIQATGIPGANLEELTRTIDERDEARRDYANLREQFESWKSAGGVGDEKGDASGGGASRETEELRSEARALENTVTNLKQELAAVQGQISQSRDQATAAQRGLALSQKALQETRDALRETSEGYSLAKSNVESLKNECSSLVQQNVSLQAQHDQVARELAAEKASHGTDG